MAPQSGKASGRRRELRDAQDIDLLDVMEVAVRSGLERHVELLLEKGVDINAPVGALGSATARPELFTMERKEHSWIGLLKDSEISCCMAATGDECLEFRHEFGSVCGRSGPSCLRTALIINPLNKPYGICKKRPIHEATDGWTSRWSVRAMELSSDLWLGRHGTLRVLRHLPDSTLLMDWRASLITTAVKSFFDTERPHREYSENIRKDARRTRPIPLFVISNP